MTKKTNFAEKISSLLSKADFEFWHGCQGMLSVQNCWIM